MRRRKTYRINYAANRADALLTRKKTHSKINIKSADISKQDGL